MASGARRTLADYNAALTARAEQYRAQAKILREQAEAVPIAPQPRQLLPNHRLRRHEFLEMARDLEDLADSIQGLRFRDD